MEIQYWCCLLLEAYVTESSELQLFIQAVDSTRHLCSSVSVPLRMQGSETQPTRSGEITSFLECNFSFILNITFYIEYNFLYSLSD